MPRTFDQLIVIAARVLDLREVDVRSLTKPGPAESALSAPFAGFGETLVFPDPIERAAATCSRIIANHPLVDGNKRTGVVFLEEMLDELGFFLDASDDDYVDTIERLAAGELPEADFIAWVRAHLRSPAG